MTKCAGCRVRHLNCDTQITCSECKKKGRDCFRLNVRFRHLVCPSERITRADFSKYQFFFDAKQTWIDTHGNHEFVTSNDDGDDTSSTNEPDHDVTDAVSSVPEALTASAEQSPSTFAFKSTSLSTTAQTSTPGDDPTDYSTALEQLPHDSPFNVIFDNATRMSAHSRREVIRPGEKLPADTSVSHLERVTPAHDSAWPLKSVQEGKLLQHFVTHLAPWVRATDFLAPRALADSESSLTLAIARDISARLHH